MLHVNQSVMKKVGAQIDAIKSHFVVNLAQFVDCFANFKKFNKNSSQFDENSSNFIKFAELARTCDEFKPKCDGAFSITD